jgi:hypothetical protein
MCELESSVTVWELMGVIPVASSLQQTGTCVVTMARAEKHHKVFFSPSLGCLEARFVFQRLHRHRLADGYLAETGAVPCSAQRDPVLPQVGQLLVLCQDSVTDIHLSPQLIGQPCHLGTVTTSTCSK